MDVGCAEEVMVVVSKVLAQFLGSACECGGFGPLADGALCVCLGLD